MQADLTKSLVKNTAYKLTTPYIRKTICKQLYGCNPLFLQAISGVTKERFSLVKAVWLLRAPQRPPALRPTACSAGPFTEESGSRVLVYAKPLHQEAMA